jgi:DNA-binding response OmpR family regulator
MLPTLKKLPASVSNLENIPILVVSSHPADLSDLRRILHHSNWQLTQCSGVVDAERHLHSSAPDVVICERDLPDGSWKDILACMAGRSDRPAFLLTADSADQALWSDVFRLGGFDVLLRPFDRAEVTTVVGLAWRHSRGRSQHSLAALDSALRSA